MTGKELFDSTADLKDGNIILCGEECAFVIFPKTTKIQFSSIPGVTVEFDKQGVTPREISNALSNMLYYFSILYV